MSANDSAMKSTRLEAFSDGVIAVIITIMVLELRVPHQNGWAGVWSVAPRLGVYLLSFLMVGIYWINHHDLIGRIETVDYRILWANLIFLFTLSLIPYSVDYMDEKLFDSLSTAIYGGILLGAGVVFFVLRRCVMRRQSLRGTLQHTDEAEQWKHGASLGLYLIAIAAAFYRPWLSLAISSLVTLVWIIPGLMVKTCRQDAAVSGQPGTQTTGSLS